MTVEKVLDFIRQVGKYTCMCTVAIAVLNGIINQQFWAPFYVSVTCWIGLIIWVAAILALKAYKKFSSRVADNSRP